MNLTKLLAITVLASLALFAGKTAPSGLGATCDAGSSTSGGDCAPGPVTFTGTNYPNHVHIIVTMANGNVIDDGYYQAPGGVLLFTEVLEPADTYTVTTSVHGGHDMLDNFTVTTN
jgi:hypothetical protein